MIDWLTVRAHGFWIAGLALFSAALSHFFWLAGPSFQKLLLVGLLLVGIGLSGTSRQLWQVIAAAAVAAGPAIALVPLWRTAAE